MSVASPVKQRINSLDLLRGIAVLCILVMNIPVFSSINATVQNPTAYGDFTGLNKWIWIVNHIFFDQKFMALFSTLFGAGILLMSQSNKAKGIDEKSIHFRRMKWLALFGLVHAYILWEGDILFSYALIGMVMFFLRNKPAKKLFWIGTIIFIIPIFLNVLNGLALMFVDVPKEEIADQLKWWAPSAEDISADINGYRGGWLDQMPFRAEVAFFLESLALLFYTFWRSGGLMLIGMALMKWDVLTGKREKSFYTKLAIVGFGIGITINVVGLLFNFKHEFSFEIAGTFGAMFNYIAGYFTLFGIIGLILRISKSDILTRAKDLLQNLGRMAFTNYIMQSVICTFLFYGHGFGLYGSVERTEQMIIVGLIWIFQIYFSNFWLKHYAFGPLEWGWRCLTYKTKQSIKRTDV